jgi:hypothetical protein
LSSLGAKIDKAKQLAEFVSTASKLIRKRSSARSGCARLAERHPFARAAVILPAMRPKTAPDDPKIASFALHTSDYRSVDNGGFDV